eukprot:c9301_g1_i1.p1 GENE.c9301_g1_i1~~c9301_g1_i1.p1  ORF type:complete len:394 (+),score=76.13 c9301_g1_i1:132-1313(+)
MNQSFANVKCCLAGDIRRFKVDGTLGHQGLVSKISELYGVAAESLSIKYTDDQGDMVTIGCDEDLAVALELCPQLLKLSTTPAVVVSTIADSPTSNNINRGVRFVLKNGAEVTLSVNGDAVQRLGLSGLTDCELQVRIGRSKLGDLVLAGLLNADTARQICVSHDLKVPKVCREEGVDCPHHVHHHRHYGRVRAWRLFRGAQVEAHLKKKDIQAERLFFGRDHHGGRGGHRCRHRHQHPFEASEAATTAAPHEESQTEERGDGGLVPIRRHRYHYGPSGRLRARFVKHVTVANDSPVNAGDEFTKTWRVRNESNVAWPEKVEVVVVGGDASLAVQASVSVRGAVAPNTEADVSVACRAPTTPGSYQTFWRYTERTRKQNTPTAPKYIFVVLLT